METETPLQDSDLVKASRAGNREAFGELVTRHLGAVAAIAYAVTGSLEDSEDVTQDTFLQAWQKLGDVREPEKLRSWLCALARNFACTVQRRESARGVVADAEKALETAIATQSSPAELAASRERESLVWHALEALPSEYREAMVLYYRHDRSVAEVAESLGISEDAAKMRLSRGRAKLRAEVAGIVEETLRVDRPRPELVIAIVAALPISTAEAAGASAAVAAGKAGAWSLLGFMAVLPSLLAVGFGLTGAYASAATGRQAIRTAGSEEERRQISRCLKAVYAIAALAVVAAASVVLFLPPEVSTATMVATVALALGAAFAVSIWHRAQMRRIAGVQRQDTSRRDPRAEYAKMRRERPREYLITLIGTFGSGIVGSTAWISIESLTSGLRWYAALHSALTIALTGALVAWTWKEPRHLFLAAACMGAGVAADFLLSGWMLSSVSPGRGAHVPFWMGVVAILGLIAALIFVAADRRRSRDATGA